MIDYNVTTAHKKKPVSREEFDNLIEKVNRIEQVVMELKEKQCCKKNLTKKKK